jgi:hypothetical protein
MFCFDDFARLRSLLIVMRNIVFSSFWLECFDEDGCRSFGVFDLCDFTIDMTDTCEIFRRASFKEFFNTSQTGCDIPSFFCDSSRMKCTHRQLSTWFTDRLCRYDTDWRTNLNECVSCQVHTIALLAYSFMRLTVEHTSYWNTWGIRWKNNLEKRLINSRALRRNHGSFCIKKIFCQDFSIYLFFE